MTETPITAPCALCGGEATKEVWSSSRGLIKISCPRCGEYVAPEGALGLLRRVHEKNPDIEDPYFDWFDRLHLVSGYVRERQILGRSPVHLELESIDSIIANAPSGVPDRINRSLLNLGRMSPFAGHARSLPMKEFYPVGYAQNPEEFNRFVHFLEDRDLIARRDREYLLTWKGWEKFEELRKGASDSSQAFVAMNFDKKVLPIFDEGLEKGIADAGWHPLRIDKKEHVKRIDDQIIFEIQNSRFVVADFTGQKAGVYFEVGFALGLGIPVIWCCRKEEIDDLHFDIRQYNSIDWTTHDELAERLMNRILALMGKGPEYKS